MVLYNALPKKEYERIFMCDTAQDIWKSLIITHQGNKQVKDNKIDLFVQKYEEFFISDDETFDCAFARFNTIITSLKARDESFSSRNHVRKFLRALPTKWRLKVTAIEESKSKKEKYKSLALKARKVLSEEETTSSDSNDEEYVMAVRDFKKFFRRRGKFVRQPYDDKKNFRKVKEDKKEKDDRRCINSSLDNESWQNEYDNLCKMSLRIINKNKQLKAKNDVLKKEVRLKVKLKPDEWIKDSGCSRHMTGNKDLFSSYKSIDGAYIVLNKETMKIKESINVKLAKSPPPTSPPLEDNDVLECEILEKQEKALEIKENEPSNEEIINIKESKNDPLETIIGNLNERTLRSQVQNQSNLFCFMSSIEPKNVKEAIQDESCTMAMQEELNQFKNKLDENGVVSRNKARLMAQGYNQQEGIDFDKTFAPVARLESIRILLAYACAHDFKLFQMDVKSAFLNGFINKKSSVAKPPDSLIF
ncbi:retrovirus-related pol polyprotein from transposon TNT 1-94 [Tanacetum coccineum]